MNRLRRILFFIMLYSFFSVATAQDNDHHYSQFDLGDLAWVSTQIKSKNAEVMPAFLDLIRLADADLKKEPLSVMDKVGVAKSGDKHDFYSMSQYSWADSEDKSRTGYLFLDGKKNPEAEDSKYDRSHYNEMVRRIDRLSLAYYFTGDPKYASKAVELIKYWFVNPQTRMNPNLRYAALQPGVNSGSANGILQGVVLIEMLDYVSLLDKSGSFSGSDRLELKRWFGDLTKWLLESEFGKKAAASGSNHSSWYYAQVISFSLFSDNVERARSVLPAAVHQLDVQFSADGSMPRETVRANSAMYSIYGLRSFVTIARLAQNLDDSLWERKNSGGVPILRNALSFLQPYFSGEKKWTAGSAHSEIDPYAIQVFRLGAEAYRTDEFNSALERLFREKPVTDRYTRLLGPPNARIQ